MKNIMLSVLLIFPISLMAMDKPRWNADDYANNNWPQEYAAGIILQESGMDISGKFVLDMGCGVGNFSAKMADTAGSVLGVDASRAMIEAAGKAFGYRPNLSFLRESVELFQVGSSADVLTSFFCLHWVENKQAAFNNFYKVLLPGGQMLCTIATTEERSLIMQVVGQQIAQLKEKYPNLSQKSITELTGRYSIATSELLSILTQCGFVHVTIKPKVIPINFKNKEEFMAWQRPVFMSTPFARLIPEVDLQDVLALLVDAVWDKLEKNADGFAHYPLSTTVVMAQRPE